MDIKMKIDNFERKLQRMKNNSIFKKYAVN